MLIRPPPRHRDRRFAGFRTRCSSPWSLGFLAGLAAIVAVAGCGDEGSRPEPTSSTVAVAATGCRSFPADGMATAVGDDLVLTAAHVVAGEREIVVSTTDGRVLTAETAVIDTALDLAVLRVTGLELAPLPRRVMESGEEVRRLGLDDASSVVAVPVEVVRRVNIATSDIYREGEHERAGYELEAVVSPGDSGGGIVGSDGSLLAVVFASSRESADRSWATAAEVAEPLIAQAAAGAVSDPVPCAR